MFWTVVKVLVAIGAFFCIYLTGTFVVRSFAMGPPQEPEIGRLRKVNYRYRCTICGTEVTMTAAPEEEIPHAPRHCREDMTLVVEGGEY
jgi:DNA-directed RNA polymerase subunit RPC12/RpoP